MTWSRLSKLPPSAESWPVDSVDGLDFMSVLIDLAAPTANDVKL